MKRFKSGFSLAEVLLALAIVAIIATLGFTMSRKGIEHAYNQYIYTGYNSMSIAIAEVISNGHVYDPNQGFNQDFFKELWILLHSKDIAAANTQPVIANNFIKLPFMGMITGAIVEGGNWYDLKDSDINTTTDGQQWGMTADGWQSNDGSTPVINPMNPNITGQGGGGYGAGKCKHGNLEEDCQQCLIEKYTCPHGNHIATCTDCHPNPNEGTGTESDYYGDQASCPECGGLGRTVETINHKLGCSKNKPSGYDQQMDDLNRDQDLNNGDTTADTTDYSIIKAKNGIVYRFTKGEMKLPPASEPKTVHVLKISMSVPSPKNKDEKGYSLLYIPGGEHMPLLPIDTKTGQLDSKVVDNVGILAYTIDNGETGRKVGKEYVPSKIYTAREAVCHNFGPQKVINDSLSFEEVTGAAAVGQGFRPGLDGIASQAQGLNAGYTWELDHNGWSSNDGSTPVINPMNPNITHPGRNATGAWCQYCGRDFGYDFNSRNWHEGQCQENPLIKNANRGNPNNNNPPIIIPDGDDDDGDDNYGDDDDGTNNSYDLFGCPEGIEPVQGALQLVGPRR